MGRLASWVKPVPGTTGLGLAPGALGSSLVLEQARSLVSQELAWRLGLLGWFGGGADQEPGSMGAGLAGA